MGSGKCICRKCGKRGHMTKTCRGEVAHCELCKWAASIPLGSTWTIKKTIGRAAYTVRRNG